MRRGREGDPNLHPDCWEFRNAVLEAEDAAEKGAVEALKAPEGGFKTTEDAKFWLKTRRPKDWSEKVQIEVNNREREMVEKLRRGLDAATFVRVMAVLADEEAPSDLAALPTLVEDILSH